MDALNAPALPQQTQASGTNRSGQTAATDAVISSDFETFLKMLTAQLENQDPLNPLESQDFAVQLATFSNVEQQTKTNSLLEDLSRTLGATGLSEMSAWIGREARVTGTLPFTGAPLEIHAEVPPGALTSELVVSNAQGREVARYPLDPEHSGPFAWNGLSPNGVAFSPGNYTFSVESEAAAGALPEGAVSAYISVLEARTGPRGQTLLLEGGLEVSPDEVTALRDPI